MASLLVANLMLLLSSYALPFMQTKQLIFFRERYTLLYSIDKMMSEGFYVLALVIFLFSVVFPIGKIGALLVLTTQPVPEERRDKWIRRIATIGKWSMLDVFVVAVLIVMINSQHLASATPRFGLYVFAAAILMSKVLTLIIEKDAPVHRAPPGAADA